MNCERISKRYQHIIEKEKIWYSSETTEGFCYLISTTSLSRPNNILKMMTMMCNLFSDTGKQLYRY
jgi:hypothetical protein